MWGTGWCRNVIFQKKWSSIAFPQISLFLALIFIARHDFIFWPIKKNILKLKKVRQLQSLDISTSATSHECGFNRESNEKCCFWFLFLLDFLLKLHSWLVAEVDMSKLRSCPTFFSFNIYFIGQKIKSCRAMEFNSRNRQIWGNAMREKFFRKVYIGIHFKATSTQNQIYRTSFANPPTCRVTVNHIHDCNYNAM